MKLFFWVALTIIFTMGDVGIWYMIYKTNKEYISDKKHVDNLLYLIGHTLICVILMICIFNWSPYVYLNFLSIFDFLLSSFILILARYLIDYKQFKKYETIQYSISQLFIKGIYLLFILYFYLIDERGKYIRHEWIDQKIKEQIGDRIKHHVNLSDLINRFKKGQMIKEKLHGREKQNEPKEPILGNLPFFKKRINVELQNKILSKLDNLKDKSIKQSNIFSEDETNYDALKDMNNISFKIKLYEKVAGKFEFKNEDEIFLLTRNIRHRVVSKYLLLSVSNGNPAHSNKADTVYIEGFNQRKDINQLKTFQIELNPPDIDNITNFVSIYNELYSQTTPQYYIHQVYNDIGNIGERSKKFIPLTTIDTAIRQHPTESIFKELRADVHRLLNMKMSMRFN